MALDTSNATANAAPMMRMLPLRERDTAYVTYASAPPTAAIKQNRSAWNELVFPTGV